MPIPGHSSTLVLQARAALFAHLPAKGVPSVRYYGWYRNKSRGLRLRLTAPAVPVPPLVIPSARRRRRTRWRELIQRVWGADPLRCPLCSGLLRPVEWIETPDAIRAFLEPLGLYAATTGPPGRGPPPPPAAELIDADTGESFPVGPRAPSPTELPRNKTDPLYHRRWMLPEVLDESWQPDANESFDQPGIELPPWREPRTDPRQVLLFTDDAIQADPPDSDPVFAFENSADEPDDDFIQPDDPDNAGP